MTPRLHARSRRLAVVPLAALGLLASIPAAHASTTVSSAGGTLTITGDDDEQQLQIKMRFGDAANFYVIDSPYLETGDVVPGGACSEATPEWEGEDVVKCPLAGVTRITGALGGNPAGSFEELDVDIEVPVQGFDMGAGSDNFYGSNQSDTGVLGGAGDDGLTGDVSSYTPGTGNDGLDGGLGDDRVYGYGGDDTLQGGDGKDIVDGEYGNDTVRGGGNSDKLDGGDGDDFVYGEGGDDGGDYWVLGGDGSDLLDGGDGNDQLGGEGFLSNGYTEGDRDTFVGGGGIDETWYTSRNSAVKVVIDGVANDGEMGDGGTVVENDNVMPDVELVYGSYGNDVLVGDDGAQQLVGLPGDDVVLGGGGNDDIDGRSGSDHLDGGAGDDKLFGAEDNDKVLGGDGNDTVEGGADDDDIEGGAGVDSFAGDTLAYQIEESGNDTLRAVDGNAEPISCGPGTDTAFIDSTDTVAVDPGNICETRNVTAAPAGPGGGPAGPGAGPNVTGPIDAKLGFAVGGLGVKLGKALKAKAFGVPVAVDRAGKLTITATAPKRKSAKASAAAKKVTIGKGSRTFFAAGSGSVKVKLSKKGRKALKGAKKVPVTLKVSFKDATGATTRSTKKVTLKK